MADRQFDRFVSRLTWAEVARRIEDGAAAILPVGAGAKQHGLHLPMNTDQVQAEWLASRIAERVHALIWPTLAYGHYPAFVAYAGSSSLSAPVFEAVVREIADALLDFGAPVVLVLDTGLSTIAPIDRAISGLGRRARVRHLRVHDGPRYREATARLVEQAHGSHADELETSCMLALAPELVDMRLAEASPPLRGAPAAGPLTPSDPGSPNYSRSGSFGDPTRATRAKGDILLAAMVDDLIATATAAIAEAQPGQPPKPS
jgi:creatinine amidohydrolase